MVTWPEEIKETQDCKKNWVCCENLRKEEELAKSKCTVRPNTGLFRTVESNSSRTVYGLPLYRFDSFYIVYMVPNTIFHHAKVLPLGFLGAYGLPDAP